MRIVLLGPPGAGKGTQAKALAKELGLPHISTGDLLRQNVAEDNDIGKRAKGYMEKGALVPDELVSQMLLKRIAKDDARKGFILDGYPRNMAQAESLDAQLAKIAQEIDLVVYLETSEKVVIQRLSGRLVCRKCAANFHVKNMPPKTPGICDTCGGELYQRTDDKEETIRKRLEVYLKESFPLIEYYQGQNKLHRLNSDGEAKEVLGQIVELATA